MKQWRFGMPNYPWRRDNTALIYFRDRSLEEAAHFARGQSKAAVIHRLLQFKLRMERLNSARY